MICVFKDVWEHSRTFMLMRYLFKLEASKSGLARRQVYWVGGAWGRWVPSTPNRLCRRISLIEISAYWIYHYIHEFPAEDEEERRIDCSSGETKTFVQLVEVYKDEMCWKAIQDSGVGCG